MIDAAAIRATWSTYKPVPTRNVLQLTLEVPLEQQAEVFKRLGYPVPGTETWVALALLKSVAPAEKPKQRWGEMTYAQRSGILRNDPAFIAWHGDETPEEAAEYIRSRCRVTSCAKIDGNRDAMKAFDALVDQFRTATGRQAEIR